MGTRCLHLPFWKQSSSASPVLRACLIGAEIEQAYRGSLGELLEAHSKSPRLRVLSSVHLSSLARVELETPPMAACRRCVSHLRLAKEQTEYGRAAFLYRPQSGRVDFSGQPLDPAAFRLAQVQAVISGRTNNRLHSFRTERLH